MNVFKKSTLSILRGLDDVVLFPLRYWTLTKLLSPHIKGSKSVLDVGSSNGQLAHLLEKKTGARFVGVDTKLQEKNYINVKKYDGKRLPFKDNSFDCVMFVDVLHHARNQEQLIKEARRVAKKYVLIKDHYWNNSFDFFLLKAADYMGNAPYGVALPYLYLREETWEKLFKKNKLGIMYERYFRYFPLDICKHTIYKLAKK